MAFDEAQELFDHVHLKPKSNMLKDIERRNAMKKHASEKPTVTSMYRSSARLESDRGISATFKKEMLDSPTGFHRRLEAITEEARGISFKLTKNFGLIEPEV